MKVNMQGDLDLLDTRFVKIDVFSASKNNMYLIDVYFFLNSKSIQYYQINLASELRSKEDKIDKLIKECAKHEVVLLNYTLTPEQHATKLNTSLNLRLNAINNGLAIV